MFSLLFVCLFVSLFVFSRITQYLLDRFSHKSAESDTWAGRTPQILIVIRITLWLGLRLTFCVIAVGTLLQLGESFSATTGSVLPGVCLTAMKQALGGDANTARWL